MGCLKLSYYPTPELKTASSKNVLTLNKSEINERSKHKYLYNGKELQDDVIGSVSLNWYDYGRRFYDPQLGRFTTIDPWAEKYNFQTTYSYALNNPIRYTDFLGMGPEEKGKEEEKKQKEPKKQEPKKEEPKKDKPKEPKKKEEKNEVIQMINSIVSVFGLFDIALNEEGEKAVNNLLGETEFEKKLDLENDDNSHIKDGVDSKLPGGRFGKPDKPSSWKGFWAKNKNQSLHNDRQVGDTATKEDGFNLVYQDSIVPTNAIKTEKGWNPIK